MILCTCAACLHCNRLVHATRHDKGGEALGCADALANDADDADSASELAAIFAPHQASALSRLNSTQVPRSAADFLGGPLPVDPSSMSTMLRCRKAVIQERRALPSATTCCPIDGAARHVAMLLKGMHAKHSAHALHGQLTQPVTPHCF